MNQVTACIDGLANSTAVVDCAIWAARRLDAPLCLLHALERQPERAALGDYSGALGMGTQQDLLQSLSELDETQSRLAQQSGRHLLAAAQQRAQAAGSTRIETRLRHGELVDAATAIEDTTRLFVLGEHFHANGSTRLHLDHRVERVIRSATRPVLVVTGSVFEPPQRFLLAFDGSATAVKAVEMVAASPMLAGLPVVVAMAGADSEAATQQLAAAQQRLQASGYAVTTERVAGTPEAVIPQLIDRERASMLVMGAYGHSRLRHLIVGSITTTLLRTATVPVLVLR